MLNFELLSNPLNWITVGIILYFWAWAGRAVLGAHIP